MNFLRIQKRIAEVLDKDNIAELIVDYINEVRDEICGDKPLAFCQTTKNIPLTASTYSYKIDGGGTTSRYSGMLLGVRYNNNSGATPYPTISYYTVDRFEQLYSTQEVGDPTAYTVRGDNLIINKVPSVVTSKNFVSNYFMLPDKLVNDQDEAYLDLKYYDYIIARVCERLYFEYFKEGADGVQWGAYWSKEAKKRASSLLLKESYFVNPNSAINTGGL